MPYLMISFNDTLTNDIVSFEQLDPEDQWSCSSPETICSEQAYGNIFKEWNVWVW